MLPLSLFRNLHFTMSSLTLFMLGVGMMSGVFLLAFYLTSLLGYNELQAGLIITCIPLTSMVLSAMSGPLSDRIGCRWFAVAGMALLTLAVYLFGGLTPDSTRGDIIWRLVIAGAGMGLTMAPVMTASIRHVPTDKIGISSGVTNMSRTIGTVLGVAILVAALNHHLSVEIDAGKTKAVALVEADPVLTTEVKTVLADRLRHAEVSRTSHPRV
jgi:MFS family permease